MFYLDLNHDEYADNAGFILAGAAELAVSGAVLLASAFLMWALLVSDPGGRAKVHHPIDYELFRVSLSLLI